MNLIELTDQPIDVAKVLQSVSHPDAGGEVLFLGTTRQFTGHNDSTAQNGLGDTKGQHTAFLVYEAYREMALKQMERLAEQACQNWPLKSVALVHRLGKVMPQEASVAVAVSSPHREEAFQAAKWLIDSIKADVTIWKQENSPSEDAQWVHPTNSGASHE